MTNIQKTSKWLEERNITFLEFALWIVLSFVAGGAFTMIIIMFAPSF
jgi:nitrate reductase NapE component